MCFPRRLRLCHSIGFKIKTDENITLVNTLKSIPTNAGDTETTNKCPAKEDIGNESSNGKKKTVEIKIEKDT
uniref:Uncharacterized protein n=1 Tax=Tanacetum cinerariifolium TaxID=118510 RepID=A0A699JBX9_TANCI|nr:hypothetical protein [Tanacetum cinerariifolium]